MNNKKDSVLNTDTIAKIREARANGATFETISNALGVSRPTLRKWINETPELKEAVIDGEAGAVEKVENELFNQCMAGNLTAIIFFLKNRKPDKWSDRPKTKEQKARERLETEMVEMDYRKKKDEYHPPFDFLTEPFESDIYKEENDE
jgi:hypothetical protein